MKKIIFNLFLCVGLCSCRNNDVLDSFNAIEVEPSNDIHLVIDKNKQQLKSIQDSAMQNPDRYAEAYNQSVEFHDKTEALHNEIEIVKERIYDYMGERDDFEAMDKNADAVLFKDDELSATGLKLKQAVVQYRLTTKDQLFFTPKAEKLAHDLTDIKKVQNRKGEEIDYFEYHYKGYPSIATLVKLNNIQEQATKIEHQFLQELIEQAQQ